MKYLLLFLLMYSYAAFAVSNEHRQDSYTFHYGERVTIKLKSIKQTDQFFQLKEKQGTIIDVGDFACNSYVVKFDFPGLESHNEDVCEEDLVRGTYRSDIIKNTVNKISNDTPNCQGILNNYIFCRSNRLTCEGGYGTCKLPEKTVEQCESDFDNGVKKYNCK